MTICVAAPLLTTENDQNDGRSLNPGGA